MPSRSGQAMSEAELQSASQSAAHVKALILDHCHAVSEAKAQIVTIEARAFFSTLEWMLELHTDQPEIASVITQTDNIFVVVPWRHVFCHVNLFVRPAEFAVWTSCEPKKIMPSLKGCSDRHSSFEL